MGMHVSQHPCEDLRTICRFGSLLQVWNVPGIELRSSNLVRQVHFTAESSHQLQKIRNIFFNCLEGLER